METNKDLNLLLRGRSPLIAIESNDENSVLELLKTSALAAIAVEYRPLFRWTVTDGLQRLDIDLAPQAINSEPEDVLGHIRAVTQPGVYVLLDFHPFLENPVNTRLLKDICLGFDRCEKHVLLVGHSVSIPAELTAFATRYSISLPDEAARESLVRAIAKEWSERNPGQKVRSDTKALQLLISNLAGLPTEDVRRLARNAIYDDGTIATSDLPELMKSKYELLNQNTAVSYEYETAHFNDIGGMRKLKAWLAQRKAAFSGAPLPANLDPPKGVLLIGVQGCGKSLAAKATAGAFGLPLLRLDFGAIYNKYHGESEKNLREALALASAMAPCVLWIDELEKGIAGGNDDSGTSRRILGAFLTWMSERQAGVFVVATANDISALPPELVRKGRFDEIFFVDLPRRAVRRDIFALQLKSRGLNPADFDLDELARSARGFSGAEIEQVIVSALYSAHASGESLTTQNMAKEAKSTRP